MEEYLIKINLLTDAVFGSGNSVPGFIDADVRYDECGFPYINGKTIKGKVGEMATVFVNMIKSVPELSNYGEELQQKRDKLFGIANESDPNRLKFSDCEMSKNLRECFKIHMESSNITPDEILEALTHTETMTSIDYKTGTAKKSSLRNFRVINRGITLFSAVTSPINLDEDERIILASACSLLRHLGSYETKGKGYVKVSLLYKGNDVTADFIKLLDKKVKANV
ncbi:MAG TPA: RAMP superfamily CRISPR-associated protein [Thermoclostridium sp.]